MACLNVIFTRMGGDMASVFVRKGGDMKAVFSMVCGTDIGEGFLFDKNGNYLADKNGSWLTVNKR